MGCSVDFVFRGFLYKLLSGSFRNNMFATWVSNKAKNPQKTQHTYFGLVLNIGFFFLQGSFHLILKVFRPVYF